MEGDGHRVTGERDREGERYTATRDREREREQSIVEEAHATADLALLRSCVLTVLADVRGDALERHHSAGAGLLSAGQKGEEGGC